MNLDEYQGLQKSDEQSYYYFMHKRLFEHVNIQLENTHIPNGMEKDAKKECAHYEEVIKSLGGVDLQLLGLGHNGHIGFNEPADVFDPSAWQAKSRSIAGDSVSDQSISDISLRVYKSYTG